MFASKSFLFLLILLLVVNYGTSSEVSINNSDSVVDGTPYEEDVNVNQNRIITNLFEMIQSNDLLSLENFLEKNDQNKENILRYRNEGGWTLLMVAAVAGFPHISSFLIAQGVEVNAVENDGFSALHFATHYDHYEVIDLLIAAGADVTLATNNGLTAASIARSKEKFDLAEKFDKLAEEKNKRKAENANYLIDASINGNLKDAQYLIEREGNIAHMCPIS
jgi:ankyrin repeat protein